MARVYPVGPDANPTNGHLVNGTNGEKLTNGEAV